MSINRRNDQILWIRNVSLNMRNDQIPWIRKVSIFVTDRHFTIIYISSSPEETSSQQCVPTTSQRQPMSVKMKMLHYNCHRCGWILISEVSQYFCCPRCLWSSRCKMIETQLSSPPLNGPKTFLSVIISRDLRAAMITQLIIFYTKNEITLQMLSRYERVKSRYIRE